MYNRYIGNTGKFYRVDDGELPEKDARLYPPQPPRREPQRRGAAAAERPQLPFSFSQSELSGALKGILGSFLPDGMEIGDLLLILILLLMYLEKEDEEILIILSVLIFMGFK